MSFLRLKPTLKEAINTNASPTALLMNFSQVTLKPFESYLQYSDVDEGIAFDGNYSVHVCDCKGVQLLDITEKVAIQEMTINGLPQIAFELAPINREFYQPITLKFRHTVSNYVWFTNLFVIKNDRKTTRFDYLDYSRPNNFYQSIRLSCWFDTFDAEAEITEYTQINGNKVSGRSIHTKLENYNFERLDNFIFRELNNLLIHPVVYVNGNRSTNKQVLKSGKRIGDTNTWKQEFTLPINYSDTFSDTFQIFPNLSVINFVPLGDNTTESAGEILAVIFNKAVTANADIAIRLYKDGLLLQAFNFADVTGNSVSYGEMLFGEYYVEIDAGGFTSIHDELSEFITWSFEILAGEYDEVDYDMEDYLT